MESGGLRGRAVEPGGAVYLVCCVGAQQVGLGAESLNQYDLLRLRCQMPFERSAIGPRGLPVLVELDISTGDTREVEWSRWPAATGPFLAKYDPLVNATPTSTEVIYQGKRLDTVSPYALELGKLPGDGKRLVVYAQLGPVETVRAFLGEPATRIVGDTVFEWLDPTAPTRTAGVVCRLVGSAAGADAITDYHASASRWTGDGRYCLHILGDRLWIVPNPELVNMTRQATPAVP